LARAGKIDFAQWQLLAGKFSSLVCWRLAGAYRHSFR